MPTNQPLFSGRELDCHRRLDSCNFGFFLGSDGGHEHEQREGGGAGSSTGTGTCRHGNHVAAALRNGTRSCACAVLQKNVARLETALICGRRCLKWNLVNVLVLFGGAEFYSSDFVAIERWKEKLRQVKRSLLRSSLIDW